MRDHDKEVNGNDEVDEHIQVQDEVNKEAESSQIHESEDQEEDVNEESNLFDLLKNISANDLADIENDLHLISFLMDLASEQESHLKKETIKSLAEI